MINPCVKCPERDRCEGFKERIDAEYDKLEQELMNDEITPDEHVERYNALMELEPQSFGPPELHEHI